MNLLAPRRIALFFASFVLFFALFVGPWDFVKKAYAGYYRWLGNVLFSNFGDDGRVRFESNESAGEGYDTKLVLTNMKKGIGLDVPNSSRFMGYVPTALVVALTLATPISLRRRLIAAAWGLLLANAFVAARLLLILLYKFQGDTPLATYALGRWGEILLDFAYVSLVGSSVGTFVAPLFLWAIAALRPTDFRGTSNANQLEPSVALR